MAKITISEKEKNTEADFTSGSIVSLCGYPILVTKDYHPNFRGCEVLKNGLCEEKVYSKSKAKQWFGKIVFEQKGNE